MRVTRVQEGLLRTQSDLLGTVLKAGPYGDEPFQVLDDHGEHHSFINEDGSSPYNRYVWVPI
jgi:hypothetical protein